jgi:hypothetical protein
VKTRTRNAIALAAGLSVITAGLVWVARQRGELDLSPRALDSVPNGALLVASADLKAVRASALGASFFGDGREIPGIGKVREVCGIDPLDTLREIALAIPAAGDEGDFGLVAAGEVQDEALIACASKVIEARGGRPVVTSIGTFRAVRDSTLVGSGGEIAVRKGGPVLLGAGTYLRAMIDAAEGRSPSIRASLAHSVLSRAIGNAEVRVSVVLTPEQRKTLEAELREASGDAPLPDGAPAAKPPGTSILAGGLGVELGPQVRLHGVILCDSAAACSDLAGKLKAARDARAADAATRLVGFGAVLEDMQIEARGDQIHARVEVPEAEAKKLVERLLVLRGMRHPVQTPTEERPRREPPAPPTTAAPAPDEVIPAEPRKSPASSASPTSSASPASPTASAAPPKLPKPTKPPAAPETKDKAAP